MSALLNQNLRPNPPPRSHRHASWMTPYGRVDASFWTISNSSHASITDGDAFETMDEAFAARVVIIPSDSKISLFRVVFDFTPHLDPTPKISYQAMIPNDSEVFEIVISGQVEKLIGALEKGTTSLTDRDEQGRSLLNVSCHGDLPNKL